MISTPTYDNFSSARWVCSIPGQEELVMKMTKFEIPSVSAGVTPIGNRSEFVLQMSGSHMEYEYLECEFLLDANLLNYIKLYSWMRENTHLGIAETLPITVSLLGTDKKFQGIAVEFHDAFPIALSKLDMDTDGYESDLTCTVTFAYTAFDFVDINFRDK